VNLVSKFKTYTLIQKCLGYRDAKIINGCLCYFRNNDGLFQYNSLNTQDISGYTALMYYCKYNMKDSQCITCVRLLCGETMSINYYNRHKTHEKFNINIQNNDGDTALNIACQNFKKEHSVEIIKYMIEKGANPFITNNNGYSALIFFMINSNKDQQKELFSIISEHIPDIDYIKHLNNLDILGFIIDEMEDVDNQNISITDKYNRLLEIKKALNIVYQKEKNNLESHVIPIFSKDDEVQYESE